MDRTRRRDARLRDKPLVGVITRQNRREVIALSTEAASAGIRLGMTLTQARSIDPAIVVFEHDPTREIKAVEALARWMMTRFSPDVMPAGLSAVLLDVTGCQRVFGGFDQLIHRVTAALSHLRITARIAIAPTLGAAWAIASCSQQNGQIISAENLTETLAPLPIAALRLDLDIVEGLHRLGIETIAQLTALPRELLPARFGQTLLQRLRQATGQIAEPLTPLLFHAPIEARREFDGPIASLEATYLVFKELITRTIGELARRGAGVRTMRLEFTRPYGRPWSKTIDLLRPSRNPAELFNLLRCAQETNPGAEGDEWWAITLRVTTWQRLSEDQRHFAGQEEKDAGRELTRLVDRLSTRLGRDAVEAAELVESHLPERAWRRTTFPTDVSPTLPPLPRRPLRLFPTPREVNVMVTPSEDRQGRPILFNYRGVHRVTRTVGPERIAGLWWEGRDKTRDYFEVEDQQGLRWWIFRVNDNGRWFLHGAFE